MPLAYEILLEIFSFMYINSNPSTFMALLELNKAYSDITLAILWAELHSLESLLHLMPDAIIHRHTSILHIPSASELERLYVYTSLIQAIKMCGPSITYNIVKAFTNILHHHTISSLFPHLTHLELSSAHDPLLAFLPNVTHSGLQMHTLSYDDPLLDWVMPCLLQILPPIQALVYVFTNLDVQDFIKNIHLFPFLCDLTISLTLAASDLQIIMLHPSLQTLILIISSMLPALHTINFQHNICLLNFDFRKSFLNLLDTTIALLCQLPVPYR
ncbi:hypothetical protein EDD22DRAFT_954992 [Suillus occidentalis]|nr:hypothetical protein EDD22DRAFT_954992 [Suillus occidentalis]